MLRREVKSELESQDEVVLCKSVPTKKCSVELKFSYHYISG
jgi:hypothetical protein